MILLLFEYACKSASNGRMTHNSEGLFIIGDRFSFDQTFKATNRFESTESDTVCDQF